MRFCGFAPKGYTSDDAVLINGELQITGSEMNGRRNLEILRIVPLCSMRLAINGAPTSSGCHLSERA